MDDLIRATIHDALAVEQPPAGLRARVIGSIPMNKRETQPHRMPSLQWAAGFVAMVVTVALVAGLVYYRSGLITSPGGKTPAASSARLISPEGIAVAPDGSLYVSDYVGNRVYRVQPDGSLVVVAGGGSQYDGLATRSNLFGPAGLAFDRNGNLYIADNRGGVIRRVDRNGMLTSFATMHVSSSLNNPLGLAFDSSGVLFVGAYNGDLVAVQPDGSTSTIDLSAVPGPVVAGYLAFDALGNLYVADRNPQSAGINGGGCRIIRVKPDRSVSVIAGTGVCGYSGDGGPAVAAQLADPNGIAFDSSGNLYFADSNNHRIRRIDPQGIITTVAGTGIDGHAGDGGPALKAELSFLAGIAIRGRFLYISDSCGCMDPTAYGAIRMVRLSDGTITTVTSSQSRVVT